MKTLNSSDIIKLESMQHVYLSQSSLDNTDLSAFQTVLSFPRILGMTAKAQSGLKLHQGKWASIRRAGHADRLLCIMIQDGLDCLIVPKQVVSHQDYERICQNHKQFTDKDASLELKNISIHQEYEEREMDSVKSMSSLSLA